VWSADGEWLATTSFLAPDAPSGLTVMRRDGSDREVIVDLFVEEPRWRP